jgi:hypothetical protein
MYRVPEVSLKKMTGYVVLVVENQNMDLIENGIKEVERATEEVGEGAAEVEKGAAEVENGAPEIEEGTVETEGIPEVEEGYPDREVEEGVEVVKMANRKQNNVYLF